MIGKELHDKLKNINYDLDKIDYVIFHNTPHFYNNDLCISLVTT